MSAMLLMVILPALIFIHLSRDCVTAEMENNHQWTAVLSSLNMKSLQESRSSLNATDKNSLCAEHMKIYMHQINSSYWAIQSKYSTILATYFR
jgi:hypothetical protein